MKNSQKLLVAGCLLAIGAVAYVATARRKAEELMPEKKHFKKRHLSPVFSKIKDLQQEAAGSLAADK